MKIGGNIMNKTKEINVGQRNEAEKVFYVRFHPLSEELKEDFIEMVQLFNKGNEKKLDVEEKNGTYSVRPVRSLSAWEIVMHKYMSYSKQRNKFENGTGEYAPVWFGHQYMGVIENLAMVN